MLKSGKYKKPVLKIIGNIEDITQRAQVGTESDLRTGGRRTP